MPAIKQRRIPLLSPERVLQLTTQCQPSSNLDFADLELGTDSLRWHHRLRARAHRGVDDDARVSLSVLFHPRDDYTSLAAFAELAAVVRPDVTVATHPWGRYRFERPRADRIDEELGFSLRLIEPALFREDAPETDRPALPVLTPGPEPARRDTIVVGHRRPEAHPADGALIERVVRAVLRDRADVEWRPEADTCDVYIDHLDTDFGGSFARVSTESCRARTTTGPPWTAL